MPVQASTHFGLALRAARHLHYNEPMSRTSKGYLIGIIGTAFWSSTAVFIAYLNRAHHIQPLQLAFWRDLLVSLALIPALFLVRRSLLRLDRRQVRFFLLYGLVLALFNSIWTLSVKYNGASVSTVLVYGSAGFTALLAWWLFHEPLNRYKIIAILFSLGGCVLVSNAYNPETWQVNPFGILVGLCSGLLFAIYSLLGKESSQRKINSWSALLFSFANAVFFLFIFNLMPFLPGSAGSIEGLLPQLVPSGWLALVTLALVPTILGYGLYTVTLGYLPASIANLIATTEPAFTAILAYFFLGEQLTPIQLLGGAMIIGAVFIVRLTEKEEPQALETGQVQEAD
jgi:drug/metabolite transporter, DME family